MNLFQVFKKQAQEEPQKQEQAWERASFFANAVSFTEYNPDELVTQKGADIYKKMLRDPQVKAAYNLIVDMIVSRAFRFVKNPDIELHKEIEDFFYFNLENISSTFGQALKNILSAKATGFSINEKIFQVSQFKNKSKWTIKAIKLKPYQSFSFKRNVFGDVEALIQTQGQAEKKLNLKKFIIYVNQPEFNSVYGESDLRAAYRAYWEKDNLLKFWNIYLEKMAGGFLLAKAKEGAPMLSPIEKAELRDVLKNAGKSTGIAVPAGYDVDVKVPSSTEAFEKAIIHKDKQIAKALMIPNLLGFSEQGNTGSFAQSQTQLETFFFVVNQQADRLGDAINEQLFKELCLWNYGLEDYPRFKFDQYTEIQKREIVTSWKEAVVGNIVINTFEDEQRTRDLLGYEEREESRKDNESAEQQQEIKPDLTKEQEDLKENFSILQDGLEETLTSDWFDRVNFSEIASALDEAELNTVEVIGSKIDDSFSDLKESVAFIYKRASVENSDLNRELEILDSAISPESTRNLKNAFKNALNDGYNTGRLSAQEEIEKATVKVEDKNMKQRIKLAAKLSKQTAIKGIWSILDFVEGLKPATAAKYFESKAFTLAGDINAELLKAARQMILEGLKNNWSLEDLIDQLESILKPYLGAQRLPTDDAKRARVETIVRTNLSDSFNQARLAVFTDPELGDFVQAFEYTSILDERTTPFCKTYDGRIFKKTDPVWGDITPPNHFGCRSTMIAVTELDDYAVSEKVKGVSPSPGFGGF